MGKAFYHSLLKCMGERTMPYIMQQDCTNDAFFFLRCYQYSFRSQNFDGLGHEMHGSDCMLKPGMNGRRIDVMCQPQLEDPSQPLKPGMLNDVKNKWVGDGDQPVNRVVYNFPFVKQ